jgi:hypothetical protein
MTLDSSLAPWYCFENIEHRYTTDALDWHRRVYKFEIVYTKEQYSIIYSLLALPFLPFTRRELARVHYLYFPSSFF